MGLKQLTVMPNQRREDYEKKLDELWRLYEDRNFSDHYKVLIEELRVMEGEFLSSDMAEGIQEKRPNTFSKIIGQINLFLKYNVIPEN